MRLVLVCGPWGSGTTAVAGMLERLGAVGFGPYFHTRDPRTPNSYELLPFRDLVRRFVSEANLARAEAASEDVSAALADFRRRIEAQELGAYDRVIGRPLFLKYPGSAFVLGEICGVFDTKLVTVLRPLAQIEQTRLRRSWAMHYGQQGAELIYRLLAAAPESESRPHLRLKYDELLRSPAYVARRLAQFAELPAGRQDLERAAGFVARRA